MQKISQLEYQFPSRNPASQMTVNLESVPWVLPNWDTLFWKLGHRGRDSTIVPAAS